MALSFIQKFYKLSRNGPHTYIHKRKMRIGFEQLREKIIQVNGFQTHENKYEYTMEQVYKDVHCSSFLNKYRQHQCQ